MPADPLLPPEAVAALVYHLRAAGREVALGLESAVKVLRGTLAARDAAPDPASLALDQTLARVEQGLALLALLAPAASPAAATGAAAARREAFEAVLRLVEGARLREDSPGSRGPGDPGGDPRRARRGPHPRARGRRRSPDRVTIPLAHRVNTG